MHKAPFNMTEVRHWALPALAVTFVISILLGLACGSVAIAPGEILKILIHQLPFIKTEAGGSPINETIIIVIRLPRVLLSALIGMALSLAGAVYQGVFRNPMADPYVLGISSGSALGAVIAMTLMLRFNFLGLGTVPFLAFIGGICTMFVVYRLASTHGRLPILPLLLTGIAVSSLLSALVSITLYFSEDRLRGIMFWLLGGLSHANWSYVRLVLPYVLCGAVILLIFARDLNALLLGEEPAAHLGIPVEARKFLLLTASSLLTACAVSVSGMISFVGLVIPHITRLIVGPDNRKLLPAAALAGASFLTLADTLARTLFPPTELPVGIITALFGGPFFLAILHKKKRTFTEGG